MAKHTAPDTLNLEARAYTAINTLTRNVDPKLGYTQYFDIAFQFDPPALRHHYYWDNCDGTGRAVDALILARHMTGSQENGHIDHELKDLVLSYIGRKGLCWIPETPYRVEQLPAWRPEPPVAELWGQRGCLTALLTWYQQSKEESLKRHLDNLIEGLWDIAIKKDSYCYYPPVGGPGEDLDEILYTPGGWDTEEEPIGRGALCASAHITRPIVQYLELGNDHAHGLKLCEGLSNYTVYRSRDYGEDGSFRHHFHSRVATVAGILKYGLHVKRMDLVDWARNVYEWGRSIGTNFGWFPEFVGMQACETCCITDMIDIAIMLAEAGWEECWDQAERYGRNHLVESQFLDLKWLKQLPTRSGREAESFFGKLDERSYSRENVAEVMKGAFSGGSAPNSIVDVRRGHWWMGCCNAHGMHGLYLLWHHAVRKTERGVFINFLFNRATPWITVESHLPYQGKIAVTVHNAPVLFLRIPQWVDRETVRVDCSGKEWMWLGSYLKISAVKPGDRVTVSFSMVEGEERIRVLEDEYTVHWRGNTVLRIEPQGKIGPLYQRSFLQKAEAPLTEYSYHTPSFQIRV